MENFALIALAENLRPSLDGLIIRRVIQQQPNGFILQTRSAQLPAIKVLMDSRYPALYPSEAKPPVEAPASDFLMVLRKHLTSAELLEFRKPMPERIVELKFKTAVPSRELETMSLVIELIPNAANMILLDAHRRVVSSFNPMSPQHGVGEFDEYAFPGAGDKIDLARILEEEEIPELNEFDPKGSQAAAWIIAHVAGIGPVLAGELVHRQQKSGRTLCDEIRSVIRPLLSPPQSAWIYTEQPLGHILERNDLRRLEKAVLSPIELQSLERTHSSRLFATLFEAARFYFDELEQRTLLEHAKLPVLRDLRNAGKRMADREKRLLREQKKYEEAETLHKTAQMLTASGLAMDKRYETATTTDYYGDPPQPVQIALDPALTLRENIEKMFKRHHKAGRGRQMVAGQLAQIRNRQAAVGEQLRRLQAIKDWDTWLAIADRIAREQRAAQSETGSERAPARRRFRSLTVEGREILIGKSSRENEELTFQVAGPDDFWLHVADYSGSHVVVRNPSGDKELPESVLMKAAQLAAFYSQARNSPKAEVHFTRKKHVAKMRRAKPGLVRLLEFKSVMVEPKDWLAN